MEQMNKTVVHKQVAVGNGERVERSTVSSDETVSGAILAKRVIYYIGGVITALLALRFVLLILGASQASSFVNFIYDLSGIFVAPFNGIFSRPTYGTSTFDTATLVAIVIYSLLTAGIARLVAMNKRNPDVE